MRTLTLLAASLLAASCGPKSPPAEGPGGGGGTAGGDGVEHPEDGDGLEHPEDGDGLEHPEDGDEHHGGGDEATDDMIAVALAGGWELDESKLQMDEATKQKPASEVFDNVEVLGDVTAIRFMRGMSAFSAALGVKCDHCHDTKDFAKDTDEKKTARHMLKMANGIKDEHFGGEIEVTCYTCHQGADFPDTEIPEDAMAKMMAVAQNQVAVGKSKAKLPAEEYFENIQVMKGMPAGNLPGAMAAFSASLGVECKLCHVNPWKSDDAKPKNVARDMIGMAMAINNDYFEGEMAVGCYTCHRGHEHPPRKQGGSEHHHHHHH